MLFEQKILDEIYKWKESLKIKKRALVIKGLRQVGKTTIVQEFCKKIMIMLFILILLIMCQLKEFLTVI